GRSRTDLHLAGADAPDRPGRPGVRAAGHAGRRIHDRHRRRPSDGARPRLPRRHHRRAGLGAGGRRAGARRRREAAGLIRLAILSGGGPRLSSSGAFRSILIASRLNWSLTMNQQNERVREQILELGRRWAAAEASGDVEALGALLADDFMLVGPLGFVLDKAQYLGSRRSGDLKHESLDWEDVRLRVYGETAVAIGTQTQKSTYQGRDASGRFRVTQIAARLGGHWVLA